MKKDHGIELYSLSATSFALESTIPFDATIRAALPYRRPRKETLDLSESIFSNNGPPPEPSQSNARDIILCTTDTGEFVIVDWDPGCPPEARGHAFPALKPGLRVANVLREARPGKDTTSLGRFIKLSEEYSSHG